MIGNDYVVDYTYVNNDWGGFTCDYFLFEDSNESKMYFDRHTEMFSDVLVNNEYYSDENMGYCLINASDIFHNEYAAFYRKDNMVLMIFQQNYSILPFGDSGVYTTMNRICNEFDIESPVGLKRSETVRELFYIR